ncbi:MAG TPA: vir-repressed protein [Oxalobacteraceae bacterium]|nr:vir-repressed protein [Oxalobacteraceae bacterium]
MKKLVALLVLAGSFLSACATHETPSVHPYGAQPKPGAEGYCPPTQAIKGLC